jgi:cyanophycinase
MPAKRKAPRKAPRKRAAPEGAVRRAERPRELGRLIAIGGHEERSASGEILRHVVQLAGGARHAHVLICAGAMDDARDVLREYQRVFEALGAHTTTEPFMEREVGNADALIERLERAIAVFFTGGDQLQLTATMAGTRFGEMVRARLQMDGLIVAGTSAGAAAMSSTMIIGGPNDGGVRRCDVDLAPGLGYWRDALVDTHFSQRGRVNRLLTLQAENPQILGVGLDENTAVVVTPGRDFHVLGTGVATIFDGRVDYTNAAEAASDEPLALFGARLHVLPRGYGFNLVTREPRRPPADGATPGERTTRRRGKSR